jgi:hypothetical protein
MRRLRLVKARFAAKPSGFAKPADVAIRHRLALFTTSLANE